MSKKVTYPKEILAQFKPFKRTDGQWAIELAPGKYLHFIEPVDRSPYTCSDADFVMHPYQFIEQAEGMIKWLKEFWAQDSSLINPNKSFTVTVDLERHRKNG